MKKTRLLFIVCLAVMLPPFLSAQVMIIADFENKGTDKMCENRFERYTSGGQYVGSYMEITDNPFKEAGYNSSDKVLRIYDINYRGVIKLNLSSSSIANSSDKLNISDYNALRLKYKINNAPEGTELKAIIKINGAGDAIYGTWKNTDKEWKTLSFDFPSQGSHSMIQIFLYYVDNSSWSNTIIDGLEIFIDDVEVYNRTAPATAEMIRTGDEDLEFFHPDSLHYTCYYPYDYDTSNIPAVSCIAGNSEQTISILPATSMTGSYDERTSTITVTEGQMSTVYTVTYEIVPKLDIYLCLGQSNMSGYGEILPQDEGIIENTFLLTPATKFIPATNPLNRFSTIANSTAKISPSYGFATALQEGTNHPVGLLVNARNGSAIEWWAKGNTTYNLYDNTITRAREALKWGEIKGIIWHQGESNSGNSNAYKTSLSTLVSDFRSDLNIPNLYFVAGEIAYWRQNGNGSTAWNAMIRTISTFVPNSDWVSAEGLTPYLDETDPHFSRESAIELGRRYAEKVLNKIYGTSGISGTEAKEQIYTLKNRKITFLQTAADKNFDIFDINGKKLFTCSETGHYTFTQSGVYLLQTGNNQNKNIYKIIIK